MPGQETGITIKTVDDMQIAGVRFRAKSRSYADVQPKLEYLSRQCQGSACGPAFTLYFGGYKDGTVDLEVCVPVTQTLEAWAIKRRLLVGGPVLSILHYGPYEKIDESIARLRNYIQERALIPQPPLRQIYLKADPDNPEKNLAEIQVSIHPWLALFVQNMERVLGEERAKEILQDGKKITVETSPADRFEWLKAALARLDAVCDKDQKHAILSPCADPFPVEQRLAPIREIYEQTGDIDRVLEAMQEDPWFETQTREGNIIYAQKHPVDPDGYAKATTAPEKRMAYCHCQIVRTKLDSGMSPTFCCCSAGWFKQQWDGILRQSVRVELVKSLLKGDDICQFAVYLPTL